MWQKFKEQIPAVILTALLVIGGAFWLHQQTVSEMSKKQTAEIAPLRDSNDALKAASEENRKQIEATNDLFRAAQFAGADWASVERGVRGDKRIGAYTQPGNPNDHLLRDVRTIERFLHAQNGGRGEYGRVSFTVA